jgi:hypothetical protein
MKSNSALDAWTVSPLDYPDLGTWADKLKFLLRYAILAPSTHNTQPWLFHIRGEELDMYADRTRVLHTMDPDDRQLIMSCGAALFHLRVAMQHFAYRADIKTFPDPADPDLLARVRLGRGGEASLEERSLFKAIRTRRTNRQPFSDDPVPEALLMSLQEAAQKEGALLCIVARQEERFAVAGLIAEGDRIQWANKRFRLELAAWMHSNGNEHHDGIPGYAQGMNDLLSCAGPIVMRTFDMGEGQAAKDRDIALHSPILAVLCTESNTPEAWLAAGQALDRVLLQARVENVWASFLNQPIEVPDLRERLRAVIAQPGCPQLLLRLGFGSDVKPTPRRNVEGVLI